MTTSLSRIFLVLGIGMFLWTGFLIFERTYPKRLNFASFPKPKHQSGTSIKPIAISLPALQKTLPIVETKLKNDLWETSSSGVSYLSASPVPGEKGNSILYGHDWPSLLADLPKVKPGDTIAITYTNGQQKSFIVAYTTVVTPDNISILESSDESQITLYTCTGFFDSQRFVVTAKMKKDQSQS